MSKNELIDEILSLENFKNDINTKFSELNDCFNGFQAKYEMVNSNLSISRCCNELLLNKACVCYFLSYFYFLPNDSLSKTTKNVFYFI